MQTLKGKQTAAQEFAAFHTIPHFNRLEALLYTIKEDLRKNIFDETTARMLNEAAHHASLVKQALEIIDLELPEDEQIENRSEEIDAYDPIETILFIVLVAAFYLSVVVLVHSIK